MKEYANYDGHEVNHIGRHIFRYEQGKLAGQGTKDGHGSINYQPGIQEILANAGSLKNRDQRKRCRYFM